MSSGRRSRSSTDSWVAELEGRLVGVMHLCERKGDTFIGDGYVHPDARGRGLGRALVHAVEARVRECLEAEPPPAAPRCTSRTSSETTRPRSCWHSKASTTSGASSGW